MESDEHCEAAAPRDDDDVVIAADDEVRADDVIVADSREAGASSNDDAVLAKCDGTARAGNVWTKASDDAMTSPHDDVMMETCVGVSSRKPMFAGWYSLPKYRELPEGRSYKELYFDNWKSRGGWERLIPSHKDAKDLPTSHS